MAFALVLGALGAGGSCAVYDESDLSGPPGAGNGSVGGSGRGGSAGAGLAQPGSGNGGGSGSNGGGGTSGGNSSGSGGSVGGSEGGDGGGLGGNSGGGTTGGSGTGGGGGNPLLIDDCEDGNQSIRPFMGRTGLWYTFSEKGTISPPPSAIEMEEIPDDDPGMPQGNLAFHFTATNAGVAAAGIDLMNPNPAPKKIYNASAYQGIRFYAKASSAGFEINVRLPVADTVLGVDNCVNTTNVNTPNRCNDHFAALVELGTSWTQYEVLFAEVSQEGWGQNDLDGFTPNKLVSIEFKVTGTADFWVDHVEFVPIDG